jgi:hypothetical protein
VDFLRIWMSYYPEDFSTVTFTKLINNITAYKDLLPSGYTSPLTDCANVRSVTDSTCVGDQNGRCQRAQAAVRQKPSRSFLSISCTCGYDTSTLSPLDLALARLTSGVSFSREKGRRRRQLVQHSRHLSVGAGAVRHCSLTSPRCTDGTVC